uniref:Uncharacterized protein n=1 Tax=Glossina palpalis gambiensis TaxID=67801 RepID=A0A1B0BBM4_9MUSC
MNLKHAAMESGKSQYNNINIVYKNWANPQTAVQIFVIIVSMFIKTQSHTSCYNFSKATLFKSAQGLLNLLRDFLNFIGLVVTRVITAKNLRWHKWLQLMLPELSSGIPTNLEPPSKLNCFHFQKHLHMETQKRI